MIRILLVRHGNTDLLGRVLYGRMPGVALNPAGMKQAELLGRALQTRYKLAEVVSSPLERAVATARCIAEPQRVGVTMDESITEVDFGSWMGKPFSELGQLDQWKRYNHARSRARAPGGEFMLNVQARAWECMERIRDRHRQVADATVAVVSHGDVIRGLLLLLLGMPIDHIHRLEIAPTSVSEFHFSEGDPVVRFVNREFD